MKKLFSSLLVIALATVFCTTAFAKSDLSEITVMGKSGHEIGKFATQQEAIVASLSDTLGINQANEASPRWIDCDGQGHRHMSPRVWYDTLTVTNSSGQVVAIVDYYKCTWCGGIEMFPR